MNTDKIYFEFDLERTPAEPALNLRVLHNGTVVHELLSDQEHVKIEINDDDAQHELIIELLGKQSSHTQINDQGDIVKDAVVTVSNIVVDDIDISDIFSEKSQYRHNFNGTGDQVTERFYSTLGCNGTVTVNFSTPIYLWLLENM